MKAQAALEFLMTYGWAILIIIAVIAALYAMGVFSLPSGGLGKCSPCFPAGSALAYSDHNADTLVVTVGPSKLNNVNASTSAGSTTNQVGPFDPGERVTLSAVTDVFAGDVTVTVYYTDDASNLSHSVAVSLHGA